MYRSVWTSHEWDHWSKTWGSGDCKGARKVGLSGFDCDAENWIQGPRCWASSLWATAQPCLPVLSWDCLTQRLRLALNMQSSRLSLDNWDYKPVYKELFCCFILVVERTESCYVAQVSLELSSIPLVGPRVLGLQTWASMNSFERVLFQAMKQFRAVS